MMVLLKDDDLPSMKWQLRRIEEIYPGEDNITRYDLCKRATTNFQYCQL